MTGDVIDTSGIVKEVGDVTLKFINRFWPDKTEQEKQAMANELAMAMGQIAINKQEAASSNWFVAGWRPAVGWSCASAFAWSYVLAPMLTWLFTAFGKPITLPSLDLSAMMPILLGMLGLGGLRTYEKKTGTEGNR